ncbi:MAG: hypothetical protein ILP10_08315, partial [Lachnospiraceae bacterium]|nr:hypothetical protein [Lachnospiraceae bacterium]
MKTKIVLTAMLSLLCVMTLTGCRININTRDGSKPKVDIEIPGVDVKVGGFEDKDSAEISGSSSETPIGPIETLAIENEIGDVKVRYTDDSKVSVDYRIRVRGGSNSDNEKAADLVTV